MKNFLPIDTIKSFFRDRTLVILVAALILMGLTYVGYVLVALEPSDLQVATRYTAFGDTHFYRTKWYYLLSFVFFAVVLTGVHIALAVKLYGRQQRQLAIMLLGLTIALLIIGWIIARSVLEIAFL